MYKNLKNRKGFTLIELLAAIVILGVLMMVAIPAMTRYIENAKRDVFADTAKKYIASVRYTLLSDGFVCKDSSNNDIDCGLSDVTNNSLLIVPANFIELENDSNKSPWGKNFDGTKAWIIVNNSSQDYDKPKYEYGFYGTDDSGNGIANPSGGLGITENSISRSVAKKAVGVQSAPVCPTGASCLTVTGLK